MFGQIPEDPNLFHLVVLKNCDRDMKVHLIFFKILMNG